MSKKFTVSHKSNQSKLHWNRFKYAVKAVDDDEAMRICLHLDRLALNSLASKYEKEYLELFLDWTRDYVQAEGGQGIDREEIVAHKPF